MPTTSSSKYMILSDSDSSCCLDIDQNRCALKHIHQNTVAMQTGEKMDKCVIESDCACTNGRFQSIILIPTKVQETPASDSR